jgi:hypothetical protein
MRTRPLPMRHDPPDPWTVPRQSPAVDEQGIEIQLCGRGGRGLAMTGNASPEANRQKGVRILPNN